MVYMWFNFLVYFLFLSKQVIVESYVVRNNLENPNNSAERPWKQLKQNHQANNDDILWGRQKELKIDSWIPFDSPDATTKNDLLSHSMYINKIRDQDVQNEDAAKGHHLSYSSMTTTNNYLNNIEKNPYENNVEDKLYDNENGLILDEGSIRNDDNRDNFWSSQQSNKILDYNKGPHYEPASNNEDSFMLSNDYSQCSQHFPNYPQSSTYLSYFQDYQPQYKSTQQLDTSFKKHSTPSQYLLPPFYDEKFIKKQPYFVNPYYKWRLYPNIKTNQNSIRWNRRTNNPRFYKNGDLLIRTYYYD